LKVRSELKKAGSRIRLTTSCLEGKKNGLLFIA